ncbi:MAG: 50S ribosomal protein L11 methyltransferase [Cryomorphaceae bacterium]|nr:50S ribosomal protein L11 methyltransferase [Cryomorphaceae bacterium]
MNYTSITFTVDPLLPARDILLAELSDTNAESFVETETGLIAYFPEEIAAFSLEGYMVNAMEGVEVTFELQVIERENWNAAWEAAFQPIIVSEKLGVKAPFHAATGCEMDLIIQPKMSFGTGHHDTTWLMLNEMLLLNFNTKHVLDMGSGTGVLAILAEKMGAIKIDAIDIDDWSTENCQENMDLNACSIIRPIQGDASAIKANYDIVLANINRNVLTADMHIYVAAMNPNAYLLLSGFFISDREILISKAESLGLKHLKSNARNDWSCLVFML